MAAGFLRRRGLETGVHSETQACDAGEYEERGSLPADRAADDLLRLLDDGGEMVGAFQALGIKLVDVLRTRGARGEPAAG